MRFKWILELIIFVAFQVPVESVFCCPEGGFIHTHFLLLTADKINQDGNLKPDNKY